MSSTLYLVRKILTVDSIENLFSIADENDEIIFLDDACYNVNLAITKAKKSVKLSVISEHAEVRNVTDSERNNSTTFKLLPLEALPQLFIKHQNTITWKI